MRTYSDKTLDLIAYPLGGIGAGMVCLTGTGGLSNISLRHRPHLGNDPVVFSAVTVLGPDRCSRIIEAPVPDPSICCKYPDSGNGLEHRALGLPRMTSGQFSARFPFASVLLHDEQLPCLIQLTGWSPFVPNDEDSSSYPVAALEYTFTNPGRETLDLVYYFCSVNFMREDDHAAVRAVEGGFVLDQPADSTRPYIQGSFCASTDEPQACVDIAWFRGGWFDPITMQWQRIVQGVCENRRYPDPENGASPGGTIAVPMTIEPGGSRSIKICLSWYVPCSDLRTGDRAVNRFAETAYAADRYYQPWYAGRFSDVDMLNRTWHDQYAGLHTQTKTFTDCFYAGTLPAEILDAVSANLTILKSPTLLRQIDGRIWGWEGCFDQAGSCAGSCTHVWNYAQMICHLFPRLERTLRETEFFETQDEASGHQRFRASLPIRKSEHHDYHAACDGQLGGIIKTYRDWRISGDTDWLRKLWPAVRLSLEYCIRQWDRDRQGILCQPHHNTYDIEFWGPDSLCMSFYLGALRAAIEMGRALGADTTEYDALYHKGRAYLEENLYNGAYFFQDVQWKDLMDDQHHEPSNSETIALLAQEGPKYQYGTGCLADAVLGVWLSELSGLHAIIDEEKLRSCLCSIYTYNYRDNLETHANPQRPGFAIKKEAGLLLCTWPFGGKPSLPFVYSDEVWTGIEYQVAAHLIMKGYTQEGLAIVKGCRNRYNGRVRNPYSEYECGHWYARAQSSYALLQAYTGVRYDRVSRTLYVGRQHEPYRTFLATATGFGTVQVDQGKVTVDVVSGQIDVADLVVSQTI